MFKLLDGRKAFYQWDINRKLIVNDETIEEVHFCNHQNPYSLVCEVYTENDLRVVDVPNILLQRNHCINVYAYDGEATKYSKTFLVYARSKPEDYVYTETEVKNYGTLRKYVDEVAYTVENWAEQKHNEIIRAVTEFISEKVVLKQENKGLSTNDFTDEYKAKLDALISQFYKGGETNG